MASDADHVITRMEYRTGGSGCATTQPGRPIDLARDTRGVATGFEPVEDSLATDGCIGHKMPFRTTDGA